MDIEETQNAYERAIEMTDDIVNRLRKPLPYNLAGMTTIELGDERRKAADEIEQLKRDIARLNRQLKTWRGIADTVFTFHTGCLEGCRRALLCTCGFEKYRSQYNAEMVEANKNG